MTREALRRGGPRSMSPPKSHAVALRTTSMPKRSKSSGGAPVEPTPDVEAPASAGLGSARAVIKLWNARNGGSELVRETEVHLEARGWYVRELPPGLELRAELWAVGERGARLMRAARPARLPPAVPSEQLEAFYLRLALDQPITGGIPVGRPLNYAGDRPAAAAAAVRRRHPVRA